MAIELDHIFILTEEGAPQARLLTTLGLIEGSSNDHPGQGTANRRFFFGNTTLELLYIRHAAENINGSAKHLRLVDRGSNADASPFGLVMRTLTGDTGVPYDGWKYCPDYFANNICFHVGSNSDIVEEPLCICMPDNLPQRKQISPPENPDWKLTELRVGTPVVHPSLPLTEIAKCSNIKLDLDNNHFLELTFNHGRDGLRKDFNSDLPLILNW